MRQLLLSLECYHRRFFPLLRCLFHLTRTLPNAPLGRKVGGKGREGGWEGVGRKVGGKGWEGRWVGGIGGWEGRWVGRKAGGRDR